MSDEPLYKDLELKIDYYPTSVEDHVLEFGDMGYTLPRGILEDFGRTPRGELRRRLDSHNSMILEGLKRTDIGVDGLHVALSQAYAEEERRKGDYAYTSIRIY